MDSLCISDAPFNEYTVECSFFCFKSKFYAIFYSINQQENEKKVWFSMLIIMLAAANLYSQDWTQFRGTERNGKVTRFKAPSLWPGQLTRVWQVNVGTCDASPVLAGGKIYIHVRQGNDEVVFCLDAGTGKTALTDDMVHSGFFTIIDCGPVLAGLPGTGNLLIIKPDPKSYAEIAGYKVADTPGYAFPLISGKTIYVKDAETLTMNRIE